MSQQQTPEQHSREPTRQENAPEAPIHLPPTRSGRIRRIPRNLKDFTPSATFGRLSAHISQLVPPSSSHTTAPPLSDIVPDPDDCLEREPTAVQPAVHYSTEPNEFGVFREYTIVPREMPSVEANQSFFIDSPLILTEDTGIVSPPVSERSNAGLPDTAADVAPNKWFSPFPNPSISRLFQWTYSGSPSKSGAELQRLIDDVISAPDFEKEHLRGVNVRREETRLDQHEEGTGVFSAASGWRSGTVALRVPKEGAVFPTESDAPIIEVTGIQHRSLTEVIRAAYEDASTRLFEHIPFKLFHRPFPNSQDTSSAYPPTRVFTEAYTSDAFLEEDAKIRSQPRHPDDSSDIEYIIAPLMAWSDSTRLAAFGTASLWPIYIFLSSLSKYIRCSPNTHSSHHLAYIPSVSPSMQLFGRILN